MNKYIGLGLILLGCSCSESSEHAIFGVCYGGECNLTKMPTLVLDPDWTAEEADIIRYAVHQWESKVNIDLGKVEYSEVDCDLPGSESEVAGCIVKAYAYKDVCRILPDNTNIECTDTYKYMIVIFTKYTGLNHLSETVTHEIGHWIGLEHKSENGYVMSDVDYRDASYVTEKDVQFYKESCN
jgi:hypothetical protein